MAIDDLLGAAIGTTLGIAAASVLAPSALGYGILGGLGAYVGHSVVDNYSGASNKTH